MRVLTTCAAVALALSSASAVAGGFVPEGAQPMPAKDAPLHAATALAVQIGGHVAGVAATGSMRPALTEADLVVYAPVTFDSLKVGDVVLFKATFPDCPRCAPSTYAHRIVAVVTTSFVAGSQVIQNDQHQWVRTQGHIESYTYLTTKGDSNASNDPFRTTDVVGKIVFVVNGQTGDVRSL